MLDRNNTGLIVVDIQGKLARIVEVSNVLVNNTAKLIEGAKALNLPVICLEQNPEKLGNTVAEIQNVLPQQQTVVKYTFNACLEPDFVQAVKSAKVDNWLVCGIEAHICVYQTVMGLQALGYSVQVVTDCIASRKQANKDLAITKLQQADIEITGLEMCLYELVEDCRAAEFKTILQLIK